MKKAILLMVTILVSILGHSQYSKLVVSVDDSNDIRFLNNVETKLNRQLELNRQGKANLTEYHIKEDNTEISWGFPLSIWAMKNNIDTIKEKITTNKYELTLYWNKDLDTAFVMGFCREYYHYIYEPNPYYFFQKNITFFNRGLYCIPLHMVLLSEYTTFLSPKEMRQLYLIIRKEFIRYVDDDTIYIHDTTQTYRTVDFTRSETLCQLPWQYLTSETYRGVHSGELAAYKTPKGNMLMTMSAADSGLNMFVKIIDDSGNYTIQPQMCDSFSGIAVTEQWHFDTNRVKKYNGTEWQFKISRQIQYVGEVKKFPNDGYQYYSFTVNPLWFNIKQLENCFRSYSVNVPLFEEYLNSALYKKLNLKYYHY
jgi:hypothetical protein